MQDFNQKFREEWVVLVGSDWYLSSLDYFGKNLKLCCNFHANSLMGITNWAMECHLASQAGPQKIFKILFNLNSQKSLHPKNHPIFPIKSAFNPLNEQMSQVPYAKLRMPIINYCCKLPFTVELLCCGW